MINSNLYSLNRKHKILGVCICLHIQDNFIYAVSEVGCIVETEVYALCGMLWPGNLGQTVEKILVSQEADAEGTGFQELTTGQTRLEQGLPAFLNPMAIAQVGFPVYLQEQKENSVLVYGYVSAKKVISIVTEFHAESNGIKFLTINYHQSTTGNLCEQPKR